MADAGKGASYDPNTEVFQSRAQMVKQENCRKQWHERWSWLLDEQEKALSESEEIRKQLPKLPGAGDQLGPLSSLRYPVPVTSNGVVGWLSSKSDCQLEIYTPWRARIPIRLPDAWENRQYLKIPQ